MKPTPNLLPTSGVFQINEARAAVVGSLSCDAVCVARTARCLSGEQMRVVLRAERTTVWSMFPRTGPEVPPLFGKRACSEICLPTAPRYVKFERERTRPRKGGGLKCRLGAAVSFAVGSCCSRDRAGAAVQSIPIFWRTTKRSSRTA